MTSSGQPQGKSSITLDITHSFKTIAGLCQAFFFNGTHAPAKKSDFHHEGHEDHEGI